MANPIRIADPHIVECGTQMEKWSDTVLPCCVKKQTHPLSSHWHILNLSLSICVTHSVLPKIQWYHHYLLNPKCFVISCSICTAHSTRASQVILYSRNTDIVCTTSMYPHWTEYLILAKYWLWLPDYGFLVNRNMLEQPP